METDSKLHGAILSAFFILILIVILCIKVFTPSKLTTYDDYKIINVELVDSSYHHNHITVFPDRAYHMYNYRIQAVGENNDTIEVYGHTKDKLQLEKYQNQTIKIKRTYGN